MGNSEKLAILGIKDTGRKHNRTQKKDGITWTLPKNQR